jgi:hypothetical protein
MVDGIVWCVLGFIFGYAIGHNKASVTKERLYYQKQLRKKNMEIKLIEDRLKKCQKWSKVLAEENAEYYRRKNV